MTRRFSAHVERLRNPRYHYLHEHILEESKICVCTMQLKLYSNFFLKGLLTSGSYGLGRKDCAGITFCFVWQVKFLFVGFFLFAFVLDRVVAFVFGVICKLKA